MKKILLITLASFLLTSLDLSAELVTIHVDDSDGNGLSGVQIRYNNFSSNTISLGNTDSNGDVFADVADATRFFRAVLNSSSMDLTGPGAGGTLNFQTAEFVAHVTRSNGTDLPGVNIQYNNFGSSYISMGNTDGSGNVSMELFPGTYNFKARWKGTELIGSTSNTIEFQTSEFVAHVTRSNGTDLPGVNIQYNNFGSSYISMGNTDGSGNVSMELFPGTYNFKARLNSTELIGSTSNTIEFQTAEFVAHVITSDGTDLPGVNIQYNNFGSSYISMGNTNGSGNVSMELFPGTYNFKARLNSTELIGSTSNTIEFQTAKATAFVKDCDNNNPIQGANIRYNNFGSSYVSMGNTDVNGEVSFELFPGTYNITSRINSSTSPVESLSLLAGGATVEFNPTRVCFISSSTVKYNNFGSNYVTFNCNSYLYPGTYNFKFDDNIHTAEVSGCSMSGGLITLVDENGDPMANYPVDHPTETRNLKWKNRCGGSWSSWTSFQTDANGQTLYSINCVNNNWDNKITMVLNQTSTEQDVTVNSVFQAARINANLVNCDGLITDASGGTVKQGGGFWYTHGTTNSTGIVTLHTFPASSVKLKMEYNHASLTLLPAITAGTNEVDFMTTSVTLNHNDDIKSNKGGSWWLFDQPTMNLLPGDYNFWFKDGSSWNGPIVFAVSGCSMSGGITLPPENDACYEAAALACGGSAFGNTEAALFDDMGTCGDATNTAPGVWFSVTGTGEFFVASTDNAGTDYDTQLSVYETVDGQSCAAQLTCVDGNDDISSGINLRSQVAWTSVLGQDYLILVHGSGSATGHSELSLDCVEPLTLESTTGCQSSFVGYEPAEGPNYIQACADGGTQPYTFDWVQVSPPPAPSTILFTQSADGICADAVVQPTAEGCTIYSVVVTDANGIQMAEFIEVCQVDLDCSNNPNSAKVEICHNGSTICISESAVQNHIDHGDSYGPCDNPCSESLPPLVQSSAGPSWTGGISGTIEEARIEVYPNPTSGITNLQFTIPEAGNVDLTLYSMDGKKVDQIYNGNVEAGAMNVADFDAASLPSGVYLYQLISNNTVLSGRIQITR